MATGNKSMCDASIQRAKKTLVEIMTIARRCRLINVCACAAYVPVVLGI